MTSHTGPASPTGPPRTGLVGWQRLVVAVLAGLGVTILVVLAGTIAAVKLALSGIDPATLERRLKQGMQFPAAYLSLYLAFAALSSLAGGYVTGRVAHRRGSKAVGVLAALLLLTGVFSLTEGGGETGQPSWYPWVLLLLGPAGVLLGGSLASRGQDAPAPSADVAG